MPSGLHRSYGAHHLHFITCSCYRRLPFLGTARARDRFLPILEQTRQRYRFVVVGYVVMPEHIHLLITQPEVGTPSTVKQRTAFALQLWYPAPSHRTRRDGAPTRLVRPARSKTWATLYNLVGVVKRHVERLGFCSYFLESF
jgi:REP element-mobilizing transposase RayT